MAADVGHAALPSVARPVEVEWSAAALADLNRFATFLHDRYPDVAARVAHELAARTHVLRRHPQLGRPIGQHRVYREIVLKVLGATYALQYRYDSNTVLILRVFHGRELR